MACPDLNELFNDALQFAQHMLLTHGEFIPFGVSLGNDGTISQIAGNLGTQHPNPSEMVEFLQDAFEESASTGSIRAAGVCLDMHIVPPGQVHKRDAICVRLAHVSGESCEVFVPYTRDLHGSYQLEPAFAAAGGSFRLLEP